MKMSFYDLNQTPTDEELDTLNLDNKEDDDEFVNSHVYASDLLTKTDQGNIFLYFYVDLF